MAFMVILTMRRIRLPLLSPSLLPHPLRHPLPPSPPPTSGSSSSSSSAFSSSTPLPPRPPIKTHLQTPLPSSPHHETSDFESDSDEPAAPPDDSELPGVLQLLSEARSCSSSQDEALANLRAASGTTPTRGLVCRALWELRWDWESALLAFRWAWECVLDCPRAWHLMIWVLGKQRRFDLVWGVVRRMHRNSILSRSAMIIVMERYASVNEVSKAIKTFYAMEKFKIGADTTAFYALLHALCKNKNVEEAEELLLKNRKFFPLETESFNIVLHGWCNIIIDVVEAKRVWREMSNCCITPDGTSYAHMICCFSKVGNLFDSLRLYDEMKKRGWIPNLVIYNSLIYVLTRENCLKDSHNVFNKIIEAGLQPNVETYNSMIYPLCEAQKLEEASDVINDMIEKGIYPTVETYHAFAKAEDTEGTLKLLNRMRNAGCGPNRFTFLLIYDKFFGLDRSESALRIWSEMRRYNVIPDSSHYTALVQGLATCGWIPKALEFYNEMKSKGYSADPKLEKLFKAFTSNNRDHWGRGGNVTARGKHKPIAGVKIR